jgi:hypothetical protein
MDERAVIGAVVMGDQRLAPLLVQLAEAGTDISPIRPVLQEKPAGQMALLSWLLHHGESTRVQG